VGDAGANGKADAAREAALDATSSREAASDVHGDVVLEATADRGADARTPDATAEARADVSGADAGDGSIDPACEHCSHLPHVRPGAPVECHNGTCDLPFGWCDTGFAHCTSRPDDGCETDLSRPEHCGSCTQICSSGTMCVPSGIDFTCASGCTPDHPNVCGQACVDLKTSVENCGTCFNECRAFLQNVVPTCEQGTCRERQCKVGWGRCMGEPGCETRLDQPDNCGVCRNHQCVVAHATPTCISTGCGVPICKPGFANCNRTSVDCETPFGGAGTCWPTYRGTAALAGDPTFGARVAFGPDGSYVVAGNFGRASDFDPGPGTDVRTPVADGRDAFVTKLRADGSYAWTRTFGDEYGDEVAAVAVGTDGSIYAAGSYSGSVDFDPGPGVDLHTNSGEPEPFILKLTADGSFVWAKTFSVEFGGGEASTVGIAADGSVYLAGDSDGTIDLDPGPAVLSAHGGLGFLVKLTSQGALAWGRLVGDETCFAGGLARLAVGSDGSAWVVAEQHGSCPIDPMDRDTSTDPRLAIATFGPGGDYRAAWRVHGALEGSSLSIGSDNSIYVGGTLTDTVDFDPGSAKVERGPGLSDQEELLTSGFVLKLGLDGSFRWVQIFADTPIAAVGGTGAGVLAAGQNGDGLALFELGADGTSIFTLSVGNATTQAGSIAIGSGQFLIGGAIDGLGDFDPGPGTDVVDRGSVDFVSRYGF
jgi:hypothetical protein